MEKLGAMLEVRSGSQSLAIQSVDMFAGFYSSYSSDVTFHNANLPWVLPMYEHMERHLQKNVQDSTQLPTLQVAAMASLQKLNHYHSKAQECHYNVISTSEYYVHYFFLQFMFSVCHSSIASVSGHFLVSNGG